MADLNPMADSLIPPSSLKRFVAANRWTLVEDRPREWEVWRSPSDLPPLTITLIFDDEYADYSKRLIEANDAITHAYRISLVELMERITGLSADLFFFRIQQESVDGTISFKQAQRALESIAVMVRAAATTVVSPSHSHRGRRPAEVDQFIAEDLRLGHTKRGSFVVTAAARLEHVQVSAVSEPSSSDEGEQEDEADEGVALAPPEADVGHGDAVIPPFGRRVMTTFSRGLEAAKAVAMDTESVGTAVERGLSLELAEALERVSSEEGLQTIEVSFDWSEAVPRPVEVPQIVTFDRPTLEQLPRVSETLQIREEPRQVTLTGPVTALSRNLADEEAAESGEVTVLAEIGGRVRKVLVDLEGEAHQYAIRAYRDRFPIIVSGELVKRRSWRLEGHVEMDVEAARLMMARTSSLNHPSQAVDTPAKAIDPPKHPPA